MGRHAAFAYCLFLTLGFAADYTIVDIQKVPVSGDPASAVVRVDDPRSCAGGRLRCPGGRRRHGRHRRGARRGAPRPHRLPHRRDRTGSAVRRRRAGFPRSTRIASSRLPAARASITAFAPASGRPPAGLSNPGNCYVSALCFEPRIGVDVLQTMIATPIHPAYSCAPRSSRSRERGDQFTSALAWQFDKRAAVRFRFRWVLDATEMGDLLPLAKLPYVVGSEAKSETGEPHAAAEPNPAASRASRTRSRWSAGDGENHAHRQARRTTTPSSSGRTSRCA